MNTLPKTSGVVQVDIKEYLQELYDFDKKVASATPALLPLDSPEEFLKFFTVEHKSRMYIWNNDTGMLVGCFALAERESNDEIELLNIIINPDNQRQGWGRKIVDWCKNYAKQHNYQTIVLVTSPKNTPAINFYKKNGFEIEKLIKNYFGEGQDRYLLRCKVS